MKKVSSLEIIQCNHSTNIIWMIYYITQSGILLLILVLGWTVIGPQKMFLSLIDPKNVMYMIVSSDLPISASCHCSIWLSSVFVSFSQPLNGANTLWFVLSLIVNTTILTRIYTCIFKLSWWIIFIFPVFFSWFSCIFYMLLKICT